MNSKLIVAVLLALLGIAVAVWAGTTQLGGRKTMLSAAKAAAESGQSAMDPEAASRIRQNKARAPRTSPPAWITEDKDLAQSSLRFAKPNTPEEAGVELENQFAGFENTIDEHPDLSSMSVGMRMGVAAVWRSFMAPLISGDQPGFVTAVGQLGGLIEPGESGESPADALYQQLARFLLGAPVDLSSARVRKIDTSNYGELPRAPALPKGMVPQRAGVMMMVRVTVNADENGNKEQSTRSVDLPMGSIFPGANRALAKNAPTVEVWTPTRLMKSKTKGADIGTSVFFVWNARAKAWQPIAMRLNLLSQSANKLMGPPMRGMPANPRQDKP